MNGVSWVVPTMLASMAAVACGADGRDTIGSVDDRAASTPTTVTAESSGGQIDIDDAVSTSDQIDIDDAVSTSDQIDIDDAVSINVATDGNGRLAVAWTEPDAVRVADVAVDQDHDGLRLGEPIVVSGDLAPAAHPIERPAVSVSATGVVHVAFTTYDLAGGSVEYSLLDVDGVTGPIRISGDPRPETNLVHITQRDESPVLSWLEDSTLSVTGPGDVGPPREIEDLDELTCDCCNPVPMRTADGLTIAYRDREDTADGIVRDVAMRWSNDGETFSDTVVVADDHWFLDGCPFSGPSVARVGDDLVIAWMDRRQSRHPDQDETTIWVDRSSDGGRSFGTDLAITDGGIHRWPVLAVDDRGAIHMLWETQAVDGGISASSSTDGGRTFRPPVLLIPNDEASGVKRTPSVVAHAGRLVVTWVDREGAHIGIFDPE